MEISEYLQTALEKKMHKLDKYFSEDAIATVIMSMLRGRHVMEITIPFKGGTLRCEEATSDMYATIDSAIAKLEKQIQKYRTKLSRRLRDDVDIPVSDGVTEEEPPHKIVRTKRFALKPMDPDEAALQMELLGHSFFVFTNMETEKVNVIYRRNDGNYGLIEPEA
jgi:putative sigma-54 modulation protein